MRCKIRQARLILIQNLQYSDTNNEQYYPPLLLAAMLYINCQIISEWTHRTGYQRLRDYHTNTIT